MLRFVRLQLAHKQHGCWLPRGRRFTQVNPAKVDHFEEVQHGFVTLFFANGSTTVVGSEVEVYRALMGTPLEQLAQAGEEE